MFTKPRIKRLVISQVRPRGVCTKCIVIIELIVKHFAHLIIDGIKLRTSNGLPIVLTLLMQQRDNGNYLSYFLSENVLALKLCYSTLLKF